MVSYTAIFITVGRIVGAASLILLEPLTVPFYIVYALCGLSDILDGYVARKTGSCSKLGEKLDSIADFVLIAIMLYLIVPILSVDLWAWVWTVIIALVRLTSLAIGAVRFRQIAFLHTFANKATGLALFCFPVLFGLFGTTASVYLLCGIASLSAMEELTIILLGNTLDRNISSIAQVRTVMESDHANTC